MSVQEENFVGYSLDALDPAERQAVEEYLATHPDSRGRLNRLRQLLQPLEIYREGIEPPRGLVLATLGRVAEHIVRTTPRQEAPIIPLHGPGNGRLRADLHPKPFFSSASESPQIPAGVRRGNALFLVGLSLSILAVGFPMIFAVREQSRVMRCKGNLQQAHQVLASYATDHGLKYPVVAANEHACSFVKTLKEDGGRGWDAVPSCPGKQAAEGEDGLSYAYSLGYRDENGELQGRSMDESPPRPLMSDMPDRKDDRIVPSYHRFGFNVLYTDGNVRFTVNPVVDGHNLFTNREGKVCAGKDVDDTVLGRPEESP